jgi:hypothetical protein
MLSTVISVTMKRGALIAAANWEVVVVQFIAETAFQGLLMVPVVGAMFLVALIVGTDASALLGATLRELLAVVVSALDAHPDALAAYVGGLLVAVVGGSMLMFVIKSGTVAILVDAERRAAPIEQPPLLLDRVRAAGRFSVEGFLAGVDRYARSFVRLGIALLVVYAFAGGVYLIAVIGLYRWTNAAGVPLAGSAAAAGASVMLMCGITLVNLFYLLTQIVVVAHECSVRAAAREAVRLVRAQPHLVGGLFAVMLVLVVLATAASILATAAVGFIGFVPIVGLMVLPLQLLAWLARGLLFQFLGLTTLGAYARVLRGWQGGERLMTRGGVPIAAPVMRPMA